MRIRLSGGKNMSIVEQSFGRTKNGLEVKSYILTNKNKVEKGGTSKF